MASAAALPSTPPFYAIWEERLTEAERALQPMVRRFCEETVAHFAQEAVRSRSPMRKSFLREWAKLGMLGLQTPAELGGLGASYFARIRVVQQLARHSFACAFSLNNMQSMVLSIATKASPDVRERFLPGLLRGELVASVALTEPGGGSDLGAMKTVARRAPGGWVISGEKAWITNASIADLMVVAAQTGVGTAGISRFVVDMSSPGVSRTEPHPLAAGHPTGVGGVRFDGVFVPETCVMDRPGEGFRQSMEGINGARVHVAAMCVAALEAALGIAVRYGATRTAFGKQLLDHQGLRWNLVEVATQLEAANLLVLRGAELIHASQPSTLAAALAKKFCASLAIQGIESCMQSMGAQALLEECPLSRQLAELKMAAYADGTTEIQNERIGTYLLKHYGSI
jgi:alkylation response protein AidB-like acyl-CoA dehydrogenase